MKNRFCLLKAWAATDPSERKARHFLFVGGDYCYEVLGFVEPIIRAFDNPSRQDVRSDSFSLNLGI